VLFFFTVPLFQSLIFSSKSDGVIHINKTIDANFLKSEKKNILMYFGYVGCANICTPFLQKLSSLYESNEFKDLKEDTDIFFVNLTPNIEPSQADMFAKIFNKNFNGVYLSRKQILQLDRKFELFFSDDLQDTTQINHTDYLYFIKNNQTSKLLKSIYFTHPLGTQKLIDDMIEEKDAGL
ncbi:SCO family protein, partial [Sulfurimonas sp.]|nr:SCO family protein [Sulfurimonas sp.]